MLAKATDTLPGFKILLPQREVLKQGENLLFKIVGLPRGRRRGIPTHVQYTAFSELHRNKDNMGRED